MEKSLVTLPVSLNVEMQNIVIYPFLIVFVAPNKSTFSNQTSTADFLHQKMNHGVHGLACVMRAIQFLKPSPVKENVTMITRLVTT